MDPMLIYRSKRERGYKVARAQRVWMLSVQVGDVLESPSGALRVVRAFSRYRNGDLRGICFAIKRRSWTDRPFTWIGFSDLLQGWRPTGARVQMNDALDRILSDDIACSPLRSRLSPFEARHMP